MSWPVQDLANAVLGLLAADTSLTTYDGAIPGDPAAEYALVYTYIETPDGLTAPGQLSLTLASTSINLRAYVHCVGGTAMSARAISGRVRAALLDITPVVAGRSCSPIRWLEGQPPSRDEDSGVLVMDQVDVYGFWSVPA